MYIHIIVSPTNNWKKTLQVSLIAPIFWSITCFDMTKFELTTFLFPILTMEKRKWVKKWGSLDLPIDFDKRRWVRFDTSCQLFFSLHEWLVLIELKDLFLMQPFETQLNRENNWYRLIHSDPIETKDKSNLRNRVTEHTPQINFICKVEVEVESCEFGQNQGAGIIVLQRLVGFCEE